MAKRLVARQIIQQPAPSDRVGWVGRNYQDLVGNTRLLGPHDCETAFSLQGNFFRAPILLIDEPRLFGSNL
ncbi:hypothetical protein BJP32_15155 [Brevundimonas sp. ZS04]|nr:hypothetical protein BJP32_15155 [Brevundimonas sp. ZS04]